MANSNYGWFGDDGSQETLLAPIKDLHYEREKWCLTQLSLPGNDVPCDLIPNVRNAATLYETTEVDLKVLMAKLEYQHSDNSLQSKAASDLNQVVRSLDNWKSARNSTASRKAGAQVQGILSSIGNFLNGFNGILEIVKSADQTFGGLAYGTLSLLLTVSVQKQVREEALEDAFEELAHVFPGLQTLQQLPRTEKLKELVAEVFKLVILFCREAIDYYASKLRRLKKALSPLKMNTLSRLRKRLSDIQSECTVVALAELAETRRQLREVQGQLRRIEDTGDDTNNRMRESQAWSQRSNSQATEQYMRGLKKTLGLESLDDRSSNVVARYKTRLGNEFAGHRRKHKTARQLSPDMLRNDEAFSTWKESPVSTGLVLSGKNWLENSSIELNWLSNASICVIESTKKPTCLLSFFGCVDYKVNRRKQMTFRDIIGSFIYQLVEQSSEYVQPGTEDLAKAMESSDWKTCEGKIDYLASLLKGLEQGSEIVVAVDRLDQCRWNDPDDPTDNFGTLTEAVGSLQHLITHKDLRHLLIRVLLVMDEFRARDVAKILSWTRKHGLQWRTWDQGPETEG